jgi:hypothetical protein
MTLTAPAASAAELQLEALESKVHRALEMLSQARAENARLREELSARDRQSGTLERERQEVRQRVERLVKQVDALIKDE